MRRLGYVLTLAVLLLAVRSIAGWLSSAAVPGPADPYAEALKDLPAAPTATQLRVAANISFGTLLTDADIRAWRTWTAQGIAPGEALRRIVGYRRAAGAATP